MPLADAPEYFCARNLYRVGEDGMSDVSGGGYHLDLDDLDVFDFYHDQGEPIIITRTS